MAAAPEMNNVRTASNCKCKTMDAALYRGFVTNRGTSFISEGFNRVQERRFARWVVSKGHSDQSGEDKRHHDR